MAPRPLREWLHQLAVPQSREQAAQALAAELGAQGLLLYVRDPALEVMLPAPGMPKTQPGGPLWRAFLRRCLQESRPAARVDMPPGQETGAQAVAAQGAAIIVLGEPQPDSVLDEIEREFPLLAVVLEAQQALHIGHAEAAEAREAASQAHTLAQALDTARAASAELNLQLRREHERKDEFLAMLAHELRNPLSPLVNSLEILRRGPGGRDQQMAHQLDVMGRQLQQLRRLVDDLLDVSRVSRGLIELRRERVALEDVLSDAVEAARPLLEARGHAFQRGAQGGSVYLNGDRVRLTQVFANLLVNAAKYTDPGGKIALSVVPDQGRVSVVVQDTGVGIPQDMLARIFDMFTQVPGTLGSAQGGLGIGLTLARRLVELHGGRVSAYSRGHRQGSTFTVSLPQVAAPAAAKDPSGPAVHETIEALSAARVLVVDDNRDAAETLVALLQFMGAECRLAHEATGALQLAPAFDPHLVIMDIGLPGVDGYEAARRLRQMRIGARLVALTGYGTAQDRERALAAGFDEHVVKPVSVEAIRKLLRDLPVPAWQG